MPAWAANVLYNSLDVPPAVIATSSGSFLTGFPGSMVNLKLKTICIPSSSYLWGGQPVLVSGLPFLLEVVSDGLKDRKVHLLRPLHILQAAEETQQHISKKKAKGSLHLWLEC